MTTPATLTWWRDGEAFVAAATERLAEDDLDRPSLLPEWTRRTVLAHIVNNADALVNLLTWARTGVETPMYASPEARNAAIAETAAQPLPALLADCTAAAQRLSRAIEGLPASIWSAQVRTAQGRIVPAAEVPWMRCREVWVHAVDLDNGASFADIPEDVSTALIDDVVRMWSRRGEMPPGEFRAGLHSWGSGPPQIKGALPDLAAWVTGRSAGVRLTTDTEVLPHLPSWL